MTCLQWDHSQGQLLPHFCWYIILVLVWCQRADSCRERLVFLQLKCMSTFSACLCGRVGMQNQSLFFLSGYVLKSIWCACLKSSGVSWGSIIRRNMAGGWPSEIGCSQIVLKVLGKSGCGLRVFCYSVLLYCLLRTVPLPQVGWLWRFWYDILIWLVGEMPIRVVPLFLFIFPKMLR